MLHQNKTLNKITLVLLITIVKVLAFAAPSYAEARGSTVEIYTQKNNIQSTAHNNISIENGAIYLISNNGEKILIKGN